MFDKHESRHILTSIVSYPERGEGGNNKYRGNCSPKLIEDLLGFFKPMEICDYMCGSGTTKAAADKLGIRSHLYDLHSGFDLMNCEIPERPEFIFWHPPYWDIIKYSDVMYKASEVKEKYGYDPCKADLSRIPDWDRFVEAMNYAMMKQFCALEKGGRMAVLMGDIKKRGKLYSMLAEIIKPGTLENIIIKAQHNCFSDQIQYSGKFIPILHEYVQKSFEFEEEHLANAFAALPLLRQKVLEMLFVQELTPLEISKRMHCSVKYVYDQKYLALQKLRRLLGGEPHGK